MTTRRQRNVLAVLAVLALSAGGCESTQPKSTSPIEAAATPDWAMIQADLWEAIDEAEFRVELYRRLTEAIFEASIGRSDEADLRLAEAAFTVGGDRSFQLLESVLQAWERGRPPRVADAEDIVIDERFDERVDTVLWLAVWGGGGGEVAPEYLRFYRAAHREADIKLGPKYQLYDHYFRTDRSSLARRILRYRYNIQLDPKEGPVPDWPPEILRVYHDANLETRIPTEVAIAQGATLQGCAYVSGSITWTGDLSSSLESPTLVYGLVLPPSHDCIRVVVDAVRSSGLNRLVLRLRDGTEVSPAGYYAWGVLGALNIDYGNPKAVPGRVMLADHLEIIFVVPDTKSSGAVLMHDGNVLEIPGGGD